MKKRKNHNVKTLTSLYINYIFQKTTLIIFIVSLLLIAFFLTLLSNPWIDNKEYLLASDKIHTAYLTQGLFIIQIFNSIIIATITISLIINCVSFDSLFISYTPRSVICISKLIAVIIIMLTLSLFEILILNIIPLFVYSKYNLDIKGILSILYLFMSNLVESLFSIAFTTIFSSVISPMIIMFIFIVIRLLCNNFTDINTIVEVLLPILKIEDSNVVCEALISTPIWIILVCLLYISIYSINDLKQN